MKKFRFSKKSVNLSMSGCPKLHEYDCGIMYRGC